MIELTHFSEKLQSFCLLSCSTSHDLSTTKAMSDPLTIITWFQGYAGGIKVWVVQKGLMVLQCRSFRGQSGQHCTIRIPSVCHFVCCPHYMFSGITSFLFQTSILLVQATFYLQNINFCTSAKTFWQHKKKTCNVIISTFDFHKLHIDDGNSLMLLLLTQVANIISIAPF